MILESVVNCVFSDSPPKAGFFLTFEKHLYGDLPQMFIEKYKFKCEHFSQISRTNQTIFKNRSESV